MFHKWCTSQGKVCKMIIDNGYFENLVSTEMVQNFGLETIPHPNPYQVYGLHKGVIEVSKHYLVSFSIGKSYKDEVWCNVFPMKECHLLLGIPWLYERQPFYNGFKHTYYFKIKGKKIISAPLKPILNHKRFRGKGETLITNGECP